MIWRILIFISTSFCVSGQIIQDEILKVNVPEIIAHAGKPSVIKIWIEVKKPYHIQAGKVKDEFIVPTTLEIDGGEEFIINKQIFPTPVKFKLEGTDEYLDVYDGKFEIKTFFKTQKQIQKGFFNLNGKINYQACDSVRCLFPRTIEFLVNIEIR